MAFELNRKLNPNLPFTLADHIQYAQKRLQEGGDIHSSLEAEVRRVYPVQLEIARTGVGMIKSRTGFELPEAEAVNNALHIVNSEGAPGMDSAVPTNMHYVMESTRVIEKIVELIEESFSIAADTPTSSPASPPTFAFWSGASPAESLARPPIVRCSDRRSMTFPMRTPVSRRLTPGCVTRWAGAAMRRSSCIS
ncbi:PRD domain-containing protein [Parafannyhessea umbonata]|uniref:PRD domain-containing protein n=1 Tax=Parafannyhessea umbonata TaxID=604330 RepID=A0A1H6K7H2_9ACTN|nr:MULTISPECIES: PRD domain-containing protein [Atopobiaceae]SEH71181.1 PRD domain-containing protein [Parafannyhessea umbonata]